MEYKGRLFGKIGSKYFDTGRTSDEFDNMQKRIIDLEFAQKWIPAEEELPETGEYVFCKVKSNLPFVGSRYNDTRKFKNVDEDGCYYSITHWRPIELK